jgi:hypothetical protein
MSRTEKIVLYGLVLLSLVFGALNYWQLNSSNNQVEGVTGEQHKVENEIPEVSKPPMPPEQKVQNTNSLANELSNAVPFKVIDSMVKEGGKLDHLTCSNGNSTFSQGDTYRLFQAGGNGLYVQSEESLRDFYLDFDAIRKILVKHGYVQCVKEESLNWPWPEISYIKRDKRAALIGVTPRGVEGSIELYIEN